MADYAVLALCILAVGSCLGIGFLQRKNKTEDELREEIRKQEKERADRRIEEFDRSWRVNAEKDKAKIDEMYSKFIKVNFEHRDSDFCEYRLAVNFSTRMIHQMLEWGDSNLPFLAESVSRQVAREIRTMNFVRMARVNEENRSCG